MAALVKIRGGFSPKETCEVRFALLRSLSTRGVTRAARTATASRTQAPPPKIAMNQGGLIVVQRRGGGGMSALHTKPRTLHPEPQPRPDLKRCARARDVHLARERAQSNHPGDSIRANSPPPNVDACRNTTLFRWHSKGCPLLGGAICRNVDSRVDPKPQTIIDRSHTLIVQAHTPYPPATGVCAGDMHLT